MTDPWGDCTYLAWRLPLRPGQNVFNVTLWQDGNTSSGGGGLGGEGRGPAPEAFSLAVVRLAAPEHTALRALRIRAADGSTVAVCADPQGPPPSEGGAGVLRQFSSTELALPAAEVKPCTPGEGGWGAGAGRLGGWGFLG